MGRSTRNWPEVRERAVRVVREHEVEHGFATAIAEPSTSPFARSDWLRPEFHLPSAAAVTPMTMRWQSRSSASSRPR
jgi:hypothetical protein